MASSPLLGRVLRSFFFRRATGKAGRYARNSAKLFSLLQQVISKTNRIDGGPSTLAQFRRQLLLLKRLIQAYARGEYKALPWKSLILTVAVLLYFVSPIDVIPDFLPLVGFADDIALVMWLFKTLSADIARFEAWETAQQTAVADAPRQ
jgi:uncharacterized membrane protein YkvA (DUF1232 family)